VLAASGMAEAGRVLHHLRNSIGDPRNTVLITGYQGENTLGRKLREYVAYQASGVEQEQRGVFPRVLWLAPDEERAEVIGDCVAAMPPAAQELFAVAPQADALNVVSGTSLTQTQPNH